MLTKKVSFKNGMKENKNTTNLSSHSTTQENQAGCCQPVVKTATQSLTKAYTPPQTTKQHDNTTHTPVNQKTCVTVKYDAGFPNQLYIRGKGANLSWDKGQPLKNTKPDEWVWETNGNFNNCEFKILINDHVYENGDNHSLKAGSTLLYTPHFY